MFAAGWPLGRGTGYSCWASELELADLGTAFGGFSVGVTAPLLVLGLFLELLVELLSRFAPLLVLVALDLSDGVLLGFFGNPGGLPSILSSPSGLNRCHVEQLIG